VDNEMRQVDYEMRQVDNEMMTKVISFQIWLGKTSKIN
jgi:hypothetical protein